MCKLNPKHILMQKLKLNKMLSKKVAKTCTIFLLLGKLSLGYKFGHN